MNYKIKDICTVTSSKRIFAKDYVDSGIPFLRGKEVTDFSKTHTLISEYHIREELYNQIKSKYSVPTKGDLLITAVGTLGSLMLVNNEKFYFKDGNIIWLKNLKPLVLSKYLFYCLSSIRVQNDLENSAIGSTQRAYTIDMIKEYEIDIPSIEDQQHIVNTIGSADDLIENCEQKANKLFNIGLMKINLLNQNNELIKLTDIAKLEKGVEIGSSNYIEIEDENTIHYLRVGDLESIQNTFIDKDSAKNIASEDDILVAFDGAPGRNNIGLNGSFSSGIYKVNSTNDLKGLLYFEINSELNQKIIKDYSQGTTILHASKSIPYLVSANCSSKDKEYLNSLFNELVSLKKKIICLKKNKNLLLDKYFTSQQ